MCLVKNNKSTVFGILTGIFLLSSLSGVYADVANVFVSTNPDTPITIDLTSSITQLPTGVTATGITVTQPAHGQAQVISGQLQVIYTPNAGFLGNDSFEYTAILSDDSTQGPAIINVLVGGSVNQGDVPPAVAIGGTLNNSCLQEELGAFVDNCETFNSLTDPSRSEDLREFLEALSPKEIAAQTDLGSDMARQQVESIVKRLLALRKGMTQASLANLAFNVGDESFTWNELRDATGGAASADQPKFGSLGWYLNGNLNYGATEETEREDGYTFNSGNLTTGLDYRFSSVAVVGGALGFGGTQMDIDNDGGDMQLAGGTATLYASFFPTRRLNIDIIQSFNFQKFSTSRRIIYGDTDEIAESSTDGGLYMASLAFGYELLNARGFTWTLALRGDYLKSTIQGYEETGGGGWNLSIEERTVEQVNTDLNNSFLFTASYGWGVIVHQIDAAWIHQFEGDAEVIRGSFVEDPSGEIFEFTADRPDSDYFKLAYGLQSIWAGGNTMYFQLQTTLGKQNYFDVGLAAGFRTEF